MFTKTQIYQTVQEEVKNIAKTLEVYKNTNTYKYKFMNEYKYTNI